MNVLWHLQRLAAMRALHQFFVLVLSPLIGCLTFRLCGSRIDLGTYKFAQTQLHNE